MESITLQAEYIRRQFSSITKTEFVRCSPQIAAEQKPIVSATMQRYFETYREQVIGE